MANRFSSATRFFAGTAVVAVLWLGLQHLEHALIGAWLSRQASVDSLAAEAPAANPPAPSSSAAEATPFTAPAPPAGVAPVPLAGPWALGYQLGFVNEIVGTFAMSKAESQTAIRKAMAPNWDHAQKLANAMGLGPLQYMRVTNAAELARLGARMETDEQGLAKAIEARFDARRRHVFLLGIHVGIAAGMVEASSGKLFLANAELIGLHASAAGVAREDWLPVARGPASGSPAQRRESYRHAVSTLDAAIVRMHV